MIKGHALSPQRLSTSMVSPFTYPSPQMMFYHDGLRITLPKMPATAQNFGHPHLIPLFALTTFSFVF
ncbi:hypothetical protein K443DRAFT_677125 [Laccaria amethystina LaAM-08-1]|jgi:hypothetical protein|uniref:Uncharacterized protein n=1 Tax=Laccaria amethystina LaAM-08-1 TaxID=1095629 RepID=A0A0C9Y4E4_9AGAR|nr:hypothetical protein K443DRAFT_677125 [Laccaria amethystina LaAM-08-1]